MRKEHQQRDQEVYGRRPFDKRRQADRDQQTAVRRIEADGVGKGRSGVGAVEEQPEMW